jgi:DNA-binding Lrp family transcriptional regulator
MDMWDLDETDMKVLLLSAEDTRRSSSSIGEAVGPSGLTVSDRVRRLEESGVISGLTVDVNRGQLCTGVSVFVRSGNDADDSGTLREGLSGADDRERTDGSRSSVR